MKSPLLSQMGLISFMVPLRWMLALSSTMTVFLFLGLRDILSRKSASLPVVMPLLEVKPSYRLSLVVMPNMLSRAIFWDGT